MFQTLLFSMTQQHNKEMKRMQGAAHLEVPKRAKFQGAVTSPSQSQPHASFGDSSTPISNTVVDSEDTEGDDDGGTKEMTSEQLLLSKKGRERSVVWAHFERIYENGKFKGMCVYCKRKISADSVNGTSSLKTHISRCKKYLPNVEKNNKSKQKFLALKEKGQLAAVASSQHEITMTFVKMIVIDELPFRIVDGDGFREFCEVACPHWDIPCRQTVAKKVFTLYQCEKTKLKRSLRGKRVCLTTDTWTSVQNINYMVLTCHFVDDNWVLHKKVLNFCVIPNHKGDSIAKLLEDCLLEWEIDRLLTITVDNASSNDVALKEIIKRIDEWKSPDALVNDGKNLHMRCAAHILNLIVNDGLTLMNSCISSIRNAVRYVRSSPQRLDMFKKCIESVKLESKGLVILDVATRWNSTFLMLQSALKFRKAFDRLMEDDGHYSKYFRSDIGVSLREGPPDSDDWLIANEFSSFLKPFYDVTLDVCCSSNPTIHTIFNDLLKIYGLLQETSGELLSEIIKPMQEKYDKYWGKLETVNPYMFIGVVLDPRHKLEKLGDYFDELFGEFDDRVDENLRKVKNLLLKLFKLYENEIVMQQIDLGNGASSSQNSHTTSSTISTGSTEMERRLAEKQQRRKAMKAGAACSDVEKYLADSVEGDDDDNFDILEWWRVCGAHKYPILARVAKDVLAIPVSTIASESSFSTSGRVINPFRSSLSPKMVEALICTQNWLTGTYVALNEDPTTEDMKFCDTVFEELQKESSSTSSKGAMGPPSNVIGA